MDEGDDELLARAGRNDAAAFARLVERHRGRVMAVAARIVGSRASAEDIVQEVFTRAWIYAPRWRPRPNSRGTFGAWLSRVATNLAIDQTRRSQPLPLDDAPEPIDPQMSADDGLIDAEDRRRLLTALDSLPARQRAALALTYDDGLSNADAASVMETTVGAFELLLVRARRTLRLALIAKEGP